MATEVYIGTDKIDSTSDVALVFSPGDIKDLDSGRVASSYTITIPLTDRNRRLLKYNDDLNVFEEVTSEGMIVIDNVLVLKGKVTVVSYVLESEAEIIIAGTGWVDHFQDKQLRELDTTSMDHIYNSANIVASWTGAANAYRYPMIHRAQLFSQETGVAAKWIANDFLPMFRVVDILTSIFYPWTIAGGWLTEAAEVYIDGEEPQADPSYISDKGLDVKVNVTTDNSASNTIGIGVTKDIIFTERTIDFNNVVLNDNFNFSTINNKYTIPETGTYSFKFIAQPNWTATNKSLLTINAQRIYVRMKLVRGGVTTTIYEHQEDYVSSDILVLDIYTIYSGHLHFIEDDEIYVTVQMYQNLTNTGGSTQTITMFLTTSSQFTLVWDARCLCIGLGRTISAKEMLPDVSQMAFVKAVKEAYNLRFTVDYYNQTVYIDSLDKSFGGVAVPIAGVDFTSINTENIALNYKSTLRLKLKNDTSDNLIERYLIRNSEPFVKEITLQSQYTETGVEVIENSLFAYTVDWVIPFTDPFLTSLSIWGDTARDEWPYYPEFRSKKYLPRLINWAGLTSGITWNYEGTPLTSYPKATSVDMTTVYTTNFLTTFHIIDRGKLIKFETDIRAFNIQQFITVVSNINNEGFRAMYEITIKNNKYYGYLNKIEFGGDKAFVEMIIKH